MKRILVTILFLMIFTGAFSQSEPDERSFSYGLAKTYYLEKDYVNAYKYFLMYKYSHFDVLQTRPNKEFLVSLSAAIKFCERRIEIALSDAGSWEGKGWSEDEVKKLKTEKKETAPLIPEKHP